MKGALISIFSQSYILVMCVCAPRWRRGCTNKPAPFPGRMSYARRLNQIYSLSYMLACFTLYCCLLGRVGSATDIVWNVCKVTTLFQWHLHTSCFWTPYSLHIDIFGAGVTQSQVQLLRVVMHVFWQPAGLGGRCVVNITAAIRDVEFDRRDKLKQGVGNLRNCGMRKVIFTELK